MPWLVVEYMADEISLAVSLRLDRARVVYIIAKEPCWILLRQAIALLTAENAARLHPMPSVALNISSRCSLFHQQTNPYNYHMT